MPVHTFNRFFVAALMVGSLLLVVPSDSSAAAIDWTGGTVISDERTYTGDKISVEGNLTITGKLTLVGTELEMERSTRKALDGQVAQLNERANALQNQVDFFNAQGGRQRKAR